MSSNTARSDDENHHNLLAPVAYLESSDFTSLDRLRSPIAQNKTCIVMVQADWCSACNAAKPHFQKFAEKYIDSVMCLTIEHDKKSKDNGKRFEIVERIKPDFEGFPDYMLFKNGVYVPREITGRTEKHLADFAR